MQKNELLSLAARAKLSLLPDEEQALEADIRDMIAFADQLSHAPVSQAKEVSATPRARQDLPAPSMERDRLLEAVKGVRDGYITVPEVLGEGKHA